MSLGNAHFRPSPAVAEAEEAEVAAVVAEVVVAKAVDETKATTPLPNTRIKASHPIRSPPGTRQERVNRL